MITPSAILDFSADVHTIEQSLLEMAKGIWNYFRLQDIQTNPWDAMACVTTIYLSKEWNDPKRNVATLPIWKILYLILIGI